VKAHANSVHVSDNSRNLAVLYYNVRSLIPKLDDLHAITEVHNPDVICVVETWLGEEISSEESKSSFPADIESPPPDYRAKNIFILHDKNIFNDSESLQWGTSESQLIRPTT